ncbi:hypothetical protein SODALDRAFT_331839 [Sodiomyces alkalinus F11]|uniref:Secondary alcohol dehydrogenase n=1 Tax=Sodiomyces alkalinus (strain CBS 110278 / VKM F-3762 / F11) TaxID=1314773 RepID=A0A3N2PYX9_SODAK|nr:hypothetical protein SODALDRAFT_331839 [Sodiomyces alkalinus F11]ROT39730.1 hypothetical protein SODALDRAFT_331839 [Sodiomyces alkalinus F11]
MSRPATTADTTPISPDRFAAALAELSISTLHLKLLEIRNSISHLRTSNIQLLPFAMGTETVVGGEPGVPDPDCADAIRENEGVIDRMNERVLLIRTEIETRGLSWREFDVVAAKDEEDDPAAAASSSGPEANAEPPTANHHAPGRPNGLAAALEEEDRIATGRGRSTGGGNTSESRQREDGAPARHPAWSDGTFQTGVIRNGVLLYDEVPRQRQEGEAPSGGSGGNVGSNNDTEGYSVSASNAAPTGGTLTDEQLRGAVEEQIRRMGVDDDDYGNDTNQEGGLHL